MGLTLSQLLEFPTKEGLREQMLLALQGVGFVRKTGTGTGALSLASTSVAARTYNVRIRIAVAGELGTATFQVSTDGGTNYAAAVTVPASGIYVVGTTGATVIFGAGPEGAGESFETGDYFDFDLSVPTLPTAAWQPGSTPLTLAELMAEACENLAVAVRNIAAGGLLRTAYGPWLDLVLENTYDLPRNAARATVGNVVLIDSAGAGPFTIAPGTVWVGTSGGLRFSNVNGGTLTLGGELTLSFQAEKPGSIYVVGGGTITQLLTSMPGVTVSNPNPVGGEWYTIAGTDKETDAAAQDRAESRWPSLGIGTPAEAYDLWARTASDGVVTRTFVRPSPTQPGYIEVFLAGTGGSIGSPTIALVQDYVDERAGLTTVPVVDSAIAFGVIVDATAYVKAGQQVAASLAISQNLTALFGGGVNSVGEELPGIPIGGVVYRSQIIEQIQLAPGLRNVDLATLLPAADIALADTEVAVLTNSVAIVTF